MRSPTLKLSELGFSTSVVDGLRRRPVDTTDGTELLAVEVEARDAVEVAAERFKFDEAVLGRPAALIGWPAAFGALIADHCEKMLS